MNHAKELTMALALVTGASLMAQQAPGNSPPVSPQPGSQSSAPQTTPQPNPQPGTATPVPSTANSPEASNPQLQPVVGELEKKLDTKNAKTGDAVVVKTTEQATIADGIVIPKGSKIVGHVTDVAAHTKDNDNARVTIQFDQAELKGGQNLSIKSVLQSVAPATGSSGPSGTDALANTAGGGPAAAGTTNAGAPGTGMPAGGSSPGGSAGARTTGPTSSGPVAGSSPEASATIQTPGGPAAGTVVARNGNVAIRTTAIPGVLLANNADGKPFSNASGALLGAKQDVKLDSGTRVVVAVADAGGAKSSNNR